jgi:inorganic pyrophosphatase
MSSKSASATTKPGGRNLVASIEPQEESEDDIIINAIIETPQGSRNKYKYDEEMGQFKLSKVLPAGFEFPFSFGFVPQTLAEDGDPLDVLLLADEPVPVGCVVPARLIGVMEAEKVQKDEKTRNDRLIAVASESNDHGDLRSFKKINPHLMREMEYFFVSYHRQRGNEFRILNCLGPGGARKVLDNGFALYRRRHGRRGIGKA